MYPPFPHCFSARRGSPAMLFLFLAALLLPLAAGARTVQNFNQDWRYSFGAGDEASAAVFDDSGWAAVGLPHSFGIPYYGATNSFLMGVGWYRKHFDLPAPGAKRFFLEFDGVFQVADVWVNGARVGGHRGGYNGFSIDITGACHAGVNTVSVRVDNIWRSNLAPRAGEHQFNGGIYRDVRLVTTDPVHVAWYGTAITTPKVTRESGTVDLEVEIRNDSAAGRDVDVLSVVRDPLGRAVAEATTRVKVGASATVLARQQTGGIRSPLLWSPESPSIYTVDTRLTVDGLEVDRFASSFGFRWFEFTADRGFFLNGSHLYLLGANVHQDHAGWADAVTRRAAFRDVGMIKEAGFNFIRGSHYPHSPAFTQACDTLGVLFWSENAFWGTGGTDGPWGWGAYPPDAADQSEFEQSVRDSLREMIRIHRNHPSIVVWSECNEVFFSDGSVLPKVREFLKSLVAYTHELDPSRPAAIGGCQRGDIDRLGDLAGYNGDGARLFVNPGIPNLVSEYGSPMVDRPGVNEPGYGDLPLTPGASAEPGSWRFPWRSGEVIWCGFDHGSIAGRNFGAMGLVDYQRLPKRQWYWYREHLRGIPPAVEKKEGEAHRLSLTADSQFLPAVDGTEDVLVTVQVLDREGRPLANCPKVDLEIVSGPGEFPTGRQIAFAADSDLVIRDGSAAVEFRSYQSGRTVLRATSPGLLASSLTLDSAGSPAYVEGVTPLVARRPYVRPVALQGKGKSNVFGLENPTRVSSQKVGAASSAANDGTRITSWLAEAADTEPRFSVDFERIVRMDTVHLVFPGKGRWELELSGSNNWNAEWTSLTAGAVEDGDQLDVDLAKAGLVKPYRFLRVTLKRWPEAVGAGLTEVSVEGAEAHLE